MTDRPAPDVHVVNEGPFMLFDLLSPKARTWVDEHVAPDAMYWGDGLVVEPRYAYDLAQAMLDAGLEVQ